MSLSSEWSLAIHRAIWFPVLYAMGLEGEGVGASAGMRFGGAQGSSSLPEVSLRGHDH